MITKLIIEEFLTSGEVKSYQDNIYTEFYKNPSSSDLNNIYKNNDNSPGNSDRTSARGFIDDEGNLYAWTANIMHYYGLHFLKNKGMIKNDADDQLINSAGFTIFMSKNKVCVGESNTNFFGNKDSKLKVKKYMTLCKSKNKLFNFYCSKNFDEEYLIS